MINECFIGKNITLDIILNALYVNNKKMMFNIAPVNWQKLINLEILCHLTVFILSPMWLFYFGLKKRFFFKTQAILLLHIQMSLSPTNHMTYMSISLHKFFHVTYGLDVIFFYRQHDIDVNFSHRPRD